MKTKIILLVLLCSVISLAGFSQTRNGQHPVYANGSRGEITKGEAVLLHKKRHHIRHDLRRAKMNDGKIGPLERKHIRQEMKQYKRQRFVAKHNRRKRG